MHSICRNLYRAYSGNTINSSQLPPLNLGNIRKEYVALGIKKYFCTSENTLEQVYKEVSQGDEEVEYRLKVLTMEMELLRQEGELVPETDKLKAKHFVELLKLKHRNGRKKYLEYIFKLCKRKENELEKKKQRALQFEEHKKNRLPKDLPFEDFVQTYDLLHNNILLRIRDKSINNLYNSKLINAMRFGQKLVFDCGFHEKMTDRENSNCAKQLMLLFGENRIHDDPYDLHLCNFDKSSELGENLKSCLPTMYDPEFPLNIHQESYLNLFPKDQLVYLTPHCRQELLEYDHNAIYIIGAIVDKVNQAPLSLAKAKEQNIKMMKFPLDRYLSWGSGSGKSLTLNQVLLILLDLKKTGDWKYALRHVPQRKLIRDEDILQDVKEKLNNTRKKWNQYADLNNLKYNRRTGFKSQKSEYSKNRMSVISSLRKE
ncbi:mitochondrial ribonuclease P protein 1 homolog [Coccinella septempunctata]|uniref:mitochondrial ribonuclease P protein 1 homolog n=1 Tax=Coccinella septempunctata TaxID=41139 RepID=UPI001D071BA4|nr:mitochondrial ribonuclease P protein 1 homolog [Coccinella septempunctata]